MEFLEQTQKQIKKTTLIAILACEIFSSCAKTQIVKIIKSEDYLNKSKWKTESEFKIYTDIYTPVFGLLARIMIEDKVNLPTTKMLDAIDSNKDKYIVPEEFYKFKKERRY